MFTAVSFYGIATTGAWRWLFSSFQWRGRNSWRFTPTSFISLRGPVISQAGRQAGITLLHPCRALCIHAMSWFWKSRFRAIFHKLRYSRIKLFAPAEDCLAYTPNGGGREVATSERRTVNRDFSYKSCKCEMNTACFLFLCGIQCNFSLLCDSGCRQSSLVAHSAAIITCNMDRLVFRPCSETFA